MAKKNKNRTHDDNTESAKDAHVIEFGSEHTFYIYGRQAQPGRLYEGQIITVHGVKGEFKVIGRRMEGKKLFIETERMFRDPFFKVKWEETDEVYGVEAIVRKPSGEPLEYRVTHRGDVINIPTRDCMFAD